MDKYGIWLVGNWRNSNSGKRKVIIEQCVKDKLREKYATVLLNSDPIPWRLQGKLQAVEDTIRKMAEKRHEMEAIAKQLRDMGYRCKIELIQEATKAYFRLSVERPEGIDDRSLPECSNDASSVSPTSRHLSIEGKTLDDEENSVWYRVRGPPGRFGKTVVLSII